MANEQFTAPYSYYDYGSGYLTPALAKDWGKATKFKYSPQIGANAFVDPGTATTPSTKGLESIDPISQEVRDKLDYAQRIFPLWQQLQQSAAKTAAESTRQQMSDLYPYLSAANAEATARNFRTSVDWLLTKEQTPTAQAYRNQIAQGQMATAASAEAERDRATAAQQEAATNFARRYAGQTFSTA